MRVKFLVSDLLEYDAASAGNRLLGNSGNQWPSGWSCHISITHKEDISYVMSIKKEVIPAEKEVK